MLGDIDSQMRASGAWVIGEIGHNRQNFKDLLQSVLFDKNEEVRKVAEMAGEKIKKREEGVRVLLASSSLQFCRKTSYRLALEGYETDIAITGSAYLVKGFI